MAGSMSKRSMENANKRKPVIPQTLTLDALACLSLHDLFFRGCFRCEFVATDLPFDAVNLTSAVFPSLVFFIKAEEAFLIPEGFSFLVLL